MRARRRTHVVGWVASLAAVVLLASASGARAQDGSIESGDWRGTALRTEPSPAGATVTGAISWRRPSFNLQAQAFQVTLSVTESVPSQEGCGAPWFDSTEPTPDGEATVPTTFIVDAEADGNGTFTGSFDETLHAACNGRYTVDALIQRLPSGAANPTVQLQRVASVANPPGSPRALRADRAEDGEVELRWDAPAGDPAPDFTGYRVERVMGGSVTELATDLTARRLVDDELVLVPGETVEYRVTAARRGATTSSRALSEPATTSVVAPVPDDGTGGGNGNGNGPADGDGDGQVDGEGGDGQVGGTGAGGPSGAGGGARPRVGTGAPPSRPLNPVSPPTTVDTGFDERLPFDPDRMVGPAEAVLPEDDLAAALIFDERPGAALAAPGATAAVLAVWAMHLGYLNRLARRPIS